MINNQFETVEEKDPQLARRVTPEEFTAAVAAIQKRKAEHERLLAETVAVDEVVRDLNIDATPEEVLAEVEAQRKTRQARRRPGANSNPTATVNLTASLPSVTIVRSSARKNFERLVTSFAITAAVIGVLISAFNQNLSRIFLPNVNLSLSSVRVNHPVTISNSELARLITGASPASITVTDHEDLHNSTWTIVNEDGKYYIWAYAIDPFPANTSKTQVTLYNDMGDVPTDSASKLTVPVDALKGDSVVGDGEDGTIPTNGLSLDNHKDDAWADD